MSNSYTMIKVLLAALTLLPFLLMLGLHTMSNISNSLLRMISDYMPGYLLAIRH